MKRDNDVWFMTHYEDAALGSDYALEQTFSHSRIFFGGEGKSTLNGGDNGDRLYGMGGDDTLTGNGGNGNTSRGQILNLSYMRTQSKLQKKVA